MPLEWLEGTSLDSSHPKRDPNIIKMNMRMRMTEKDPEIMKMSMEMRMWMNVKINIRITPGRLKNHEDECEDSSRKGPCDTAS